MENKEVCKVVNLKWEAFKKKAKEKYEEAKVWIAEHKDYVIAIAPAVIAGVVEVVKIAAKGEARTEEKELKELYVYDRSMGHYWKLRRKLTNAEYRELERRRAEGESMGENLESMRVLG